MANEFKHKTVGTVLTQAEWEATDGTSHQLDSQATGDIIYASSSTVLSRLGIGSTNGFLVVASGLPAWDTSPTVTDDLTFNLGTGNDVVLLNRSSILAANTALSNVMIGTPVTPAVAANSLLVSNVTASGDYLLALNNGGNSQAWHWVDSSAGTQTLYAAGVARILLNSTGGSFTGTWSDLGTVTTVDINGGSIDGAAIGAASHSTIKGTTIDATTDFTIGSTVITDDKVAYGAAGVFQMVAATEDALKFTDGTNDLMRFNTKVDTDRMNFLDVGTPGAAVSFAAASNSSFRLFRLLNYTVTLTGDAANPAAMEGLMLYSGIPTLTDSTAVTVTKASSIYVQAPVEAGSVTLTGAMALHIADAGGTPTNQYGIYIDALTAGATKDYSIYTNAGDVRFGGSVSIDGDIDFEGAQEIATSSGTLTLAPSGNDGLVLNGSASGVTSHTQASFSAQNVTLSDGATAKIRKLLIANETATLAGTTRVTDEWNYVQIHTLTVAQSGGAVTVDNLNAMSINAPLPTTSVTATNVATLKLQSIGNVTGAVTSHYGLMIEGASDAQVTTFHQIFMQTPVTAGTNYSITIGNTDADQSLIHVGATGDPTFWWDESEDAFSFTKGVQVDESARTLASGANAYAVRLKTTNAITTFGSGTNALVATLRVDPPNITDGGATLSDTACLYIDNDATEGQGNYAIWVNAGNTRLDGDVDLNGTADLLNVGAAGNDWTTNEIVVSGSYAGTTQTVMSRNTENGNAASHARLALSTGGASGGDPYIIFDIAGTQAVALGLDNTTSDNFTISDNGTLGTNDRLRLVTTTGVLSVDGDGGGSDDPVSLFDDYDDVAELRRYQLAIPGSPITIAERDENRQRLVEMGVGEWAVQESGPDRWMMRVQPLTRLLAGGIYQNRERMVSIEERLAALEAKGG